MSLETIGYPYITLMTFGDVMGVDVVEISAKKKN